ncbi:MAG: hypothetical protein ACI81I_000524 [Arcobacteraceae bacterium]|jgi:hypothetical protein
MSNNKDYILLERFKQQVEESTFYFKPSKEKDKRIREYLKGDQLPQEVKSILAEREQPEMWENILKSMDTKIAGLKISSKQQIQAFGRQRGSDKKLANIITNILKTMQDTTEWFGHKKRADASFRTSGLAIMQSNVKATGEKDLLGVSQHIIGHRNIPFSQSHIDPFAISPDYSDSRYFHEERLLVVDELYRFFPKEKVNKLQTYSEDISGEYSNTTTSLYSKRARVYYGYEREWNNTDKRYVIYYMIWSNDVILERKELQYNLTKFPISIRRMDELDYDTPSDVRGLYYNLLPIQDRINNCHLRAIHMMGTNKMLFESDAVDDAETFIEEYSQDSAVVEVKAGALRDKKILDIKQYNEIANLRAEIADLRRVADDIIGLNAEVLGSAVNRMSGSAIENRQNAGLIGLQEFINASTEQDKDIAETDLPLIQQYYKAEQIYRITDKSEADGYFVANELELDQNGVAKREKGTPVRKNSLQIGTYDITLQQMPHSRGSTADRQRMWTEVMKGFSVTHPHLLPQMQVLSLEDTESPVAAQMRELVEQDKKNQAENGGQAQQLEMQEMQLNLQKLTAQIAEINSKAKLNNSKVSE